MSELILPEPFLQMAESGRITSNDVARLRMEVFKDDLASRVEAEAMIALDRSARNKCPEWSDFFSEVLTNFIVFQEDPTGVISQKNAEWLLHCISRSGLVDSREMFEMLVKALEKAQTSPDFLMSFALDQIKQAVLENQGPLSRSGSPDTKIICKADVDLIRRLMFAFGGDGGMAVTQAEAEFLFDLNDQTVELENDPSWSGLFVKAIGNHLLATLGNSVPPRHTALADELWMHGEGIYDKMINSLRATYKAFLNPVNLVESALANNNTVMETGQARATVVTERETEWLANRIGADGILHENEKALLQFLTEESAALPDRLKTMLQSVA